jgi:hypothetical protein
VIVEPSGTVDDAPEKAIGVPVVPDVELVITGESVVKPASPSGAPTPDGPS